MFKVKNKKDGKIHTVYGVIVKDDIKSIYFVMYNKKFDMWELNFSSDYIPIKNKRKKGDM